MYGKKIIPATKIAPVEVRSIMPAETSLATLASSEYSFLIKSVMDSIEVFTISAERPRTIVKIKIVISR